MSGLAASLRTRAVEAKGGGAYGQFKKEYFGHPDRFIQDCFDWQRMRSLPAAYQLRDARALIEHKRVSERGPRGLGKTALAAMLAHWFALSRDGKQWKVITTSGSGKQLTKYLWPEIRWWARYLRWDRIGRDPYREGWELKKTELELHTGQASAFYPDDPALIEGAHADHLLFLYDEGKSLTPELVKACEGAFSGAGDDTDREAYALMTGNPGDAKGVFWDIRSQKKEWTDWHPAHVTIEDAIEAGRISREWADKMLAKLGKDHPMYINQVEGEFAEYPSDCLVPIAWFEAAVRRGEECGLTWIPEPSENGKPNEDPPDPIFAIDPAGMGEDNTCDIKGRGHVIEEIVYTAKDRPTTIAGRVMQAVGWQPDSDPDDPTPNGNLIMVDDGAESPVSILAEKRFNVVGIKFGAAADFSDRTGRIKFANMRSAILWKVREEFDPDQPGGAKIAIPDDDNLKSDCIATKWEMTTQGLKFWPKDKIKKHNSGRSPDGLDCLGLYLLGRDVYGGKGRDWFGLGG